jgi:hypothetical protein
MIKKLYSFELMDMSRGLDQIEVGSEMNKPDF